MNSTKITILLCLTILVTSILVMSYNEYVNRFSIIVTQDNGIYIFDKKSAVLNKCENGHCTTIQTHFPQNPLLQMNNNQTITQQYATNLANNSNNNILNRTQSQQQISNNNLNNNTNQLLNNNNKQQNNNIPQVTIVNTKSS